MSLSAFRCNVLRDRSLLGGRNADKSSRANDLSEDSLLRPTTARVVCEESFPIVFFVDLGLAGELPREEDRVDRREEGFTGRLYEDPIDELLDEGFFGLKSKPAMLAEVILALGLGI